MTFKLTPELKALMNLVINYRDSAYPLESLEQPKVIKDAIALIMRAFDMDSRPTLKTLKYLSDKPLAS